MDQGQAGGVQGDRRPQAAGCRKGKAGTVRPVTDDRAPAAGKLGPQLVASSRGGLERNERDLPRPSHDPGPHMALPGLARNLVGLCPLIVTLVVITRVFQPGVMGSTPLAPSSRQQP